jgi:hypothetical protein
VRGIQQLLSHVVGGVEIAVDGDFPAPPANVLAGSAEASAIQLRLRAAPDAGPLRPSGAPAFEADSWVAFVDGDTVRLCIKNATKTPPEAMRIELPREGLEGRYLFAHDYPYPFRYPIDQLLVVHALGIAGGALMHAAAIAGRDGALLVSGPSGAGKTTISRAAAAQGASVLSDERSIVRPSEGGWLLAGTTWPGEGGFIENRSLPLRGLVMLEQAPHDELIPLSPARAFALLYRCHFPPLWDARACDRTLANIERLVRDVPAFLFRNKKGPEAATRLLAQVGGP